MADESKRKKKEIDANDLIREYEEQSDGDSPEEQSDMPWYEQAKQDTKIPKEAAVTGGDIDAAWDQAASVGDETVGGSNPTPDQDVVEDIGRGVGVTYEDAEPLRPTEKLEQRDEKRWELNPASSEDYSERQIPERSPADKRKSRKEGTKRKRKAP